MNTRWISRWLTQLREKIFAWCLLSLFDWSWQKAYSRILFWLLTIKSVRFANCIQRESLSYGSKYMSIECSHACWSVSYMLWTFIAAEHARYVFFFFFEHNRTPNRKKMVTGVQVITASQAQNIGCRWQALFVLSITEAHTSRWWARAQSLTKRNPLTTHGVEA